MQAKAIALGLVVVAAAAAPCWAEAAEENPPDKETPAEAAPESGGQPADAGTAEDSADGTSDEAFLAGKEEAKPEIEAPVVDQTTTLAEPKGKAYYSLGVRYRTLMIPIWFIEMFGIDTMGAAPVVTNPSIGAEFTYRKDGFDIIAAVWYAGLDWNGGFSYKENGEDPNSWEVITNNLSGVFITADFIWSTSIVDWFAITYGAGLGIGFTWGEVVGTEASADSGYRAKCPREPAENETPYDIGCNYGEDYGEVYFGDAHVFPWVEFLLGMRFKPHRNIAINLDGGFGLGFQTGVRIAYIF